MKLKEYIKKDIENYFTIIILICSNDWILHTNNIHFTFFTELISIKRFFIPYFFLSISLGVHEDLVALFTYKFGS